MGAINVSNLTYLAGCHNKGVQGPAEEFPRHGDLQTSHDHYFLRRGVGGGTGEACAWGEGRS